uniref:Uncharacterized protein n=1 Tax=Rhipicephalus appendiculatus TaxID=34631 RepID=A0A131YF59_RHIAP
MNAFMAPLQPMSSLLFLVFSIINWEILEYSFPIGEVRNRNGTGCSIHGRRSSPDFAELDQPRADWIKGRMHHILLSLSRISRTNPLENQRLPFHLHHLAGQPSSELSDWLGWKRT